MKTAPQKIDVTVSLTPAAYGMLVAMAAYDRKGSVEDWIVHDIATGISSFCEAIGDTDECVELFKTGKVARSEEAA